jgi:hypothetical protein
MTILPLSHKTQPLEVEETPEPESNLSDSVVPSRTSSMEDEVTERGIVLDIIKEVIQEPEFVDNVAGCCVHFIRSTCCAAPKKADS